MMIKVEFPQNNYTRDKMTSSSIENPTRDDCNSCGRNSKTSLSLRRGNTRLCTQALLYEIKFGLKLFSPQEKGTRVFY